SWKCWIPWIIRLAPPMMRDIGCAPHIAPGLPGVPSPRQAGGYISFFALVRHDATYFFHSRLLGSVHHLDVDSVRHLIIELQEQLSLPCRSHVPAQLGGQIVEIDRLLFHLNRRLVTLHANDDMDHLLLHLLLGDDGWTRVVLANAGRFHAFLQNGISGR